MYMIIQYENEGGCETEQLLLKTHDIKRARTFKRKKERSFSLINQLTNDYDYAIMIKNKLGETVE